MDVIVWIGKLIWFFLPAGVANMTPVFVKNRFQRLAKPIDGGLTWLGQPLFGAHKTWRGLVSGIVVGELLFLVQHVGAQAWPALLQMSAFDHRLFPWWFGCLLGGTALLGDLIKSFFKRRFHIVSGASWFPFDQIDYLIGPLWVTMLYVHVDILAWVIGLSLGIIFHILANRLGFRWHLKVTPW